MVFAAVLVALSLVPVRGTALWGAADRPTDDPDGPYARLVLNSEPVAYWRLDGAEGGRAGDRTGAGHHAAIEQPVEHGQSGPQMAGFCGPDDANRCFRFTGGRLIVDLPDPGDEYSVVLWFRNEQPNDLRPVTGVLFSRGTDDDGDAAGDRVVISGTAAETPGQVGVHAGDPETTGRHGGPVIEPGTWHHLVFVRRGTRVEIYLDGAAKPAVAGDAGISSPAGRARFSFGGRDGEPSTLDGMLDEIAVYDRALPPSEARLQFRQAGYPHTPSRADVRAMERILPREAVVVPAAARRLLILDRANGFYHPAIPLASRAIEAMGERTGAFRTALDHGYGMLAPGRLAAFDAIVLNNTSNWKISDQQKSTLLGFVENGGGLMALHGAAWNFAGWPEGQAMIGGHLAGHPWHDAGTWAVKIDEPDHPLCRAFGGEGFWIHDEIYMFTAYSRDRLRVLLSLDMTKTANRVKGGRADNDHAVSWIHRHGNGRVFFCSLGNNVAPFHDPRVMRHWLDGIQWILGDLPADATPSARLAEPPIPAFAPDR